MRLLCRTSSLLYGVNAHLIEHYLVVVIRYYLTRLVMTRQIYLSVQ